MLGTALEFSFYLFLLAVGFGILLLIWFLRWVFGGKDVLAVFPHTASLPNLPLKESKKLLQKIQDQIAKASVARKAMLIQDLDLLDRTIAEIQTRTENQQAPYYQLCKEREETWNYLKDLHGKMSIWQRFNKKRHPEYGQVERYYRELEQRIRDAAQHAKFQSELYLSELHRRGVFERNAHLLGRSKNKKTTEDNAPSANGNTSSTNGNASSANGNASSANGQENHSSEHQISETQESEIDQSKSADTDRQEFTDTDQPEFTESEEQSDLPPSESPPAMLAKLSQEDFPKIGTALRHHLYLDEKFNLAFAEDGILRYYDFEESIFQGVHFQGVHQYDRCSFRKVDLSEARWMREGQPHRFHGCDFTGATLQSTCFMYTIFSNCRFDRSDWKHIRLQKVKFVHCSLDGISWENVDLSQAYMSEEMLEITNFDQCAALPYNHPERQQNEALEEASPKHE